jgi:type IV secretory pathway TrbF-like protein
LRVSKPTSSNPFIVSTKSEEEIVGKLGKSAKGLKIAAIICFVLAAGGAVAGVMNMMKVF